MIFLHPEFIYYMLIPLFALFALLLTQKGVQEQFFDKDIIAKLRVDKNSLSLRVRNILFFFMATLMILALAQPVIKDGVVEVKAKSADIIIAMDISDSMLATDVYPDRLRLAKEKALGYLQKSDEDRVGVIAFAKASYLVSPLSFDHQAVSFLLSKLNTNSITEKGTDFISMLNVVEKSFKKDSKKYLLLLTDGGDKSNFSNEIKLAKKYNITVFILGMGTKKGAPIKRKDGTFIKQNGKIIVSRLNPNIASLATSTGGVYIQNTTSNEDIKTMYKEIQSHTNKKELKSEDVNRYIPLFYYPVSLALLLLLIATSSMPRKIVKTIPSVFVLFSLLFGASSARAKVFDFMDLQDAQKAYQDKDYAKSAQIYQDYAKAHHNPQSYYNAGDSFYKKGDYKKAVEAYTKANFKSKENQAKKLSNLGNAYAKQGKQKELLEAKKAYEDSLKLVKDADTQKNLDIVKKLLEKQKKKNQKKNQKKNKKNSKDKKQSKNQKNSKDKKNQKKSDKNKDSKKSDKNQKSKQNSSDKKNSNKKENQKKSASQKQKEQKQKEQKKKNLKQLDKGKKDSKKKEKHSFSQVQSAKKMSKQEEKKWLQKLNRQQNSFMYMLGGQNPKKEDTNEKPW